MTIDAELDVVQFESAWLGSRAYSEVSSRELDALQSATDDIKNLTSCQFLIEVYLAGTNVRNVLGDTDAYAAEQAEIIRSNILIVLQEMAKDPSAVVLNVLRARSASDADFLNSVRELVAELSQALEEVGN